MDDKKKEPEIPNCPLCGKPLYGDGIGPWIDDDEYGDVHVSCLDEKRPE